MVIFVNRQRYDNCILKEPSYCGIEITGLILCQFSLLLKANRLLLCSIDKKNLRDNKFEQRTFQSTDFSRKYEK